MELKTISRLPSGSATIGVREVEKGIKSGELKRVIVASNCPEWLLAKITRTEGAGNITLERFMGNERELGTALGKAFAVAMAGFKE